MRKNQVINKYKDKKEDEQINNSFCKRNCIYKS